MTMTPTNMRCFTCNEVIDSRTPTPSRGSPFCSMLCHDAIKDKMSFEDKENVENVKTFSNVKPLSGKNVRKIHFAKVHKDKKY
jgi:hypothetical protein